MFSQDQSSTSIPEPLLKETVNGFILEFHQGGVILAISQGRQRVERGQMVSSNGRYGNEAGSTGIVTEIKRPGSNGFTSNILVVHFVGNHFPVHMKFKELDL